MWGSSRNRTASGECVARGDQADDARPRYRVLGGGASRARGRGALVGQHTWIAAQGADAAGPPAADCCEQQLREELVARAPWTLDGVIGSAVLRQAAVAFSSSGAPLVGPVEDAPGLWLFTGFSGGFAQVPVLAPLLAQRLAGPHQRAVQAQRQLQQLGVWPQGADSGP